MTKARSRQATSLAVRPDQPLIGVIVEEHGQELVRYFGTEEAVDAAASDASIQDALSLAGVWSDLDWREALAELDRIRHQSQPTPPITDL